MAQLQERAELKKALLIDPERAVRRLSKNQVVGSSGECDDSKVLR
jgi:hypothetical protein